MGTTASIEEDAAAANGDAAPPRAPKAMPWEEDNTLTSTVVSFSGDEHRNDGNEPSLRDDGGRKVPSAIGAESSIIKDDDVKVNLAMHDLMMYLQIVATNSQNLPLTRRDDPELGKTVSTLTAEDYARKAEAFIPSDVRIIGGSFTKYGRVRDLPSSEVSFHACMSLSCGSRI